MFSSNQIVKLKKNKNNRSFIISGQDKNPLPIPAKHYSSFSRNDEVEFLKNIPKMLSVMTEGEVGVFTK